MNDETILASLPFSPEQVSDRRCGIFLLPDMGDLTMDVYYSWRCLRSSIHHRILSQARKVSEKDEREKKDKEFQKFYRFSTLALSSLALSFSSSCFLLFASSTFFFSFVLSSSSFFGSSSSSSRFLLLLLFLSSRWWWWIWL